MIKKLTVCVCDVCGKTVPAKPAGTQYNETYYARPDGWSKGASREIDICPECAAKLKPTTFNSESFSKQVK